MICLPVSVTIIEERASLSLVRAAPDQESCDCGPVGGRWGGWILACPGHQFGYTHCTRPVMVVPIRPAELSRKRHVIFRYQGPRGAEIFLQRKRRLVILSSSAMNMNKAVILARGLGTRMRKASDTTELTQAEADAAGAGMKALMPIGRPFLDYVLAALADAGYQHVCLVIGPEHDQIREYYTQTARPRRIQVHFAIQKEPLGTADAVLAAEQFAGGDDFACFNSDNYYPVDALQALREIDGCGLVGFDRQGMIAHSNVAADKLRKFAVVRIDENGCLADIIEKPTESQLACLPEPVYLSMNCWRFNSSIFAACRSITPSPRGELEIPDAVRFAMQSLGEPFGVLTSSAPVLDLSSRDDISSIKEKLAGMEIDL